MIKLTKHAIAQIRESARQTQSEGMALRVAVKKNPAGRFHYVMGFDDIHDGQDIVETQEGVQIVYTEDQKPLIDGMSIDFVELDGGEKNFIFLNPNDPDYQAPTEG